MIKRGMDVFTLEGEYVGTVVHVSRTAPPRSPGETPPSLPLPIAMERGREGARGFSGESLGPVPTAALGNRGPSTQARVAGFGATSAPAEPPSTGWMLLVRLLVAQQWRRSWPKVQRLPLDLVQAVAHERVILSVTASELARR